MPRKDFTGKVFGKWKALKFEAVKNQKCYWLCECVCGFQAIKETSSFAYAGKGCMQCYRKRQVKHLFDRHMTRVRACAKHYSKSKKLLVSITADDLQNLWIKQNKKCALSGEDLWIDESVSTHSEKRTNISVDRIDSLKDYTIDNVQLVSKQANLAKLDYSSEEFIQMCNRVAKTHPR